VPIIEHRSRPRGLGLTFLALLWVVIAPGCAGPRKSAPTVNPAELPDDAFQGYLAAVDLVTVDEAYRAMLILADGEDTCRTAEERRAKLEQRGITKGEWKLQPENVIDVGSVAYMVCQICQIRGGVNRTLLAPVGLGDRRYALRELVYRDMIGDSADYEYLRGAALVGLLGKADALMASKGLYPTQGIDLSDETDRDAQGNLIVPPPSR
jgi:hypothetical protein